MKISNYTKFSFMTDLNSQVTRRPELLGTILSLLLSSNSHENMKI